MTNGLVHLRLAIAIATALGAVSGAAAEPCARQLYEAAQDANRMDRLLLLRYPSEEVHHRAREAALTAPQRAIQVAEDRLNRLDIGSPDAEVQLEVIKNARAERDRISAAFDEELKRLHELWRRGVGTKRVLPPAAPATPLNPAGIDDAIVKRPSDQWRYR